MLQPQGCSLEQPSQRFPPKSENSTPNLLSAGSPGPRVWRRGFFSIGGGPFPARRNRPAPAHAADLYQVGAGAEKFRRSGYWPRCQAMREEAGPPGKKDPAQQPRGERPRAGGLVAQAPCRAGSPRSGPGSASALQPGLRTRRWSGHLHRGVGLEAELRASCTGYSAVRAAQEPVSRAGLAGRGREGQH